MGELSKYVPMSPRRVSGIQVTSADITLLVEGAVGESVTMFYSVDGQVRSVTCVMGETLRARVSVAHGACYTN